MQDSLSSDPMWQKGITAMQPYQRFCFLSETVVGDGKQITGTRLANIQNLVYPTVGPQGRA